MNDICSCNDESNNDESNNDESNNGESNNDESNNDESNNDESNNDESNNDESNNDESNNDESNNDESVNINLLCDSLLMLDQTNKKLVKDQIDNIMLDQTTLVKDSNKSITSVILRDRLTNIYQSNSI